MESVDVLMNNETSINEVVEFKYLGEIVDGIGTKKTKQEIQERRNVVACLNSICWGYMVKPTYLVLCRLNMKN